MKYYVAAFKKYAVFSGRATRSEYWYFVLFNLLAAFLAGIVAAAIGIPLGWSETTQTALAELYLLAALLPSIAIAVRRLHDIGLSGLWLLICFVPLLGGLALLVMYCQDSQPGANQFGPNPKGVEATMPVLGHAP